MSVCEKGRRRANALFVFVDLRGAEAPLFHGAAGSGGEKGR
jgi:hypothetical protein